MFTYDSDTAFFQTNKPDDDDDVAYRQLPS